MKYFDYAAATPLSEKARKVMEPYLTERFYNPSAQYLAAQAVKKDIEKARAAVAGVLMAKPQEIIFTAGGTEANNLAIQGVMRKFPDANCVVSAIEHDAVLEPTKQFNYKIAPVDKYGIVDADKLKKLIDHKTVLVSVMYANNEIGTVQLLASIGKMIHEINWARIKSSNSLPLYFHTDACQAPNYLPILVNSLGVDMMSLNGGKIYGPKQSGVLYVKRDIELEPLIYGGGQEKGVRNGTENVPNIIGFAAALTEADSMREVETARVMVLRHKAFDYLEKNLPEVRINSGFLANNLHITVPGVDNERLMMELDEKGFQVAVGSACSASNDEPSHVLKAIGLSDTEARSSLRITMGRATTESGLMELLRTIKSLLKN